MQELLLTLRIYFTMVFAQRKKHIVTSNSCVFRIVSKLCAKYKLNIGRNFTGRNFTGRNFTAPCCARRYHHWYGEETWGLTTSSSGSLSSSIKRLGDSSSIEATEGIPSTPPELVSCTDFDNLSSAVRVASNPGFPSQILSCSLEIQSCETKTRMENLGLRLLQVVSCLLSHLSLGLDQSRSYQQKAGRQHTIISFIVQSEYEPYWNFKNVKLNHVQSEPCPTPPASRLSLFCVDKTRNTFGN